MRSLTKIFAIGLVAISLGGCATIDTISNAVKIGTTSVANPVTKTDLYKVEASLDIAITALVTYRRACLAGAADANCRANIKAIQVYTKAIPPYIMQLRVFVKTNDQVNARVVYNNLSVLFTNMKATAAGLGVNLGV